MRPLLSFLLAAWMLVASAAGHAATVCVSTAVNLVQALGNVVGQPEGSTYTIKVVQGTYAVGNALGTLYQPPDYVSVKLLGGYTAGCASRTINPANTVIDAQNVGGSATGFQLYGDTVVLIEGLTFTRFRGGVLTLLNLDIDDDQSTQEIRHCRIINSAGNIAVWFSGAKMILSNTLVAGNTLAGADAVAVYVQYTDGSDSAFAGNNNTIANNSGGSGLHVQTIGTSFRLGEITNNIIWGNGLFDLDLLAFFYTGNSMSVHNNLYGTMLGTPIPADNVVGNPLFANAAAGDYSLALISPAINNGAATQYYSFPSRDLANGTRIVGSRVDRGAFESPQNDLTGFIVSTTADNGNNTSPSPGSLRAAIKAGNAAGTPYKVSFALTGGCPRIVNITTALPDITGDVQIDATTQAGWVANSSYGLFDATLCLVLNGGGNVPWAFHVPSSASNAHLTIKGMMMAGYTDAAIKLEGGHDHHVLGNQIGAIAFTSDSDKGVYVGGSASGVYIGGFDDTSAVNLIAGTTTAGVYLENASGGSVVANNVIGFLPDGIGAVGNGLGVYLFNSPGNLIDYNIIGNSSSAGIQLAGSGAQQNLVQHNFIGVNAQGLAAGNVSSGVALSFGARLNTIGAPLSGGYGTNIISRNGGPGVWVTPSGGAGNRVLSGYFDQNAGLAIDLDGAGPSANPVAPGSSGPNLRQAYPVLSQAIRSTNPTADNVIGTLSASTSNAAYRIDFYRASACGAGGRGAGGSAIGRINVVTNSAGVASINTSLALPTGSTLGAISATATDGSGNTSELGNCVIEATGSLPPLFANGFE